MYYAAYAREDGPPDDGGPVATTTGWHNWVEFVAERPEEYPAAAHLAEWGWSDKGAELEEDLERLAEELNDPNMASVTRAVLAAVRATPEGTVLVITDGEPGEGEDDDEDDEDD